MIAREGHRLVISGVVLTALLLFVAFWYNSLTASITASIIVLLTAFAAYFFRDPKRTVPEIERVVISPADGTVVAIENVPHHDYLGCAAVKISIFLSVFNVHVNRVPSRGKIDYVKYTHGKFLAANIDKASELNEQTEIGLIINDHQRVVFKQIAGFIARRIICYLRPGQSVSAGERFGMIRFGSRMDLILPSDTEIRVKLKDKVKGGLSLIGVLKETPVTNVMTAENRGGDVKL